MIEYYPVSKRLKSWFKSQHFGRGSVDSRYALLEACLIGFLSGLAAILVKQGVGALGGLRVHAAERWGALWVLPATGLILGLSAGYLLQEYSPAASGGGIPQVKAALARYPMILSLRVAWVKALGTILVLGAGLTLGRRAPTVHIGAALAAQLSQWLPTSPEHRRQMIAAGAAAGLAAGFNTPIAGILFVIEELMRDASGLTLETAVIASFTGSVVSRLLGATPLSIAPIISHQALDSHFALHGIPILLLLGTLAGIIGAYFNQGLLWTIRFSRRLNLSLPQRIGIAGLISGTIVALLPPFFRDNSGLREVLVTGEATNLEILIAFIAHFFLTMIAYSSGAPGGLFAPALIMGSSLGYLLGEVFGDHTSLYALVGMGAFFTGIVRVPVTATVIVFEMTADFNLVLPLMVTCATAYIVAESVFSRSIYDHLLQNSGIELKENVSSSDFLSQLTAADVMQSKVESFSSELTLDEVKLRMSLSHHRGFPVVSQGELVGIITQTDLDRLEKLSSPKKLLKDFMTHNPITVRLTTPLSDVLYLLNRYQLSRLPVTNGLILVGIITRTDIIRAEVKKISGVTENLVPRSPSYLVYRTQFPSVGGKNRLLLVISSPTEAYELFAIASAIARQQELELECLQVFVASNNRLLTDTPSSELYESRHLMQRLERSGRNEGLIIHTQTRLAHSTSDALLDSWQVQLNSLLVMETREKVNLEQISCPVIRVQLGSVPLSQSSFWLVTLTERTEKVLLMNLLRALISLVTKKDALTFYLCIIVTPGEAEIDFVETILQFISSLSKATIIANCLKAASLKEGVTDFIKACPCEVIILNTEDESILEELDGTVIFLRDKIEDT